MKLEILCTTMHRKDISKYNEMNLQTDAVIANQADCYGYEETKKDGKSIKFITTNTRGLSFNRNIALTYSTADIIVFADDDQRFIDGYEKIILDAFNDNPDADAIKFYNESANPERPLSFKRPKSFCKATKKSLMSAGVNGLAIKREFLLKNNIFFNINVGSGTEIFCGEDSVFYNELIKRKATMYLSPVLLSYINQQESSWFKGYTQQFFNSCGYVYALVYGELAPLVIVRRAIKTRKRKGCDVSIVSMIKLMLKGFSEGYKNR